MFGNYDGEESRVIGGEGKEGKGKVYPLSSKPVIGL